MKRKIIHIEKDLCNGCGLCVDACHEGAIGLVEGKATLLRDDYCDGLGDCLPVCPTGAITFQEREAAAFDKQAVLNRQAEHSAGGCPGACPKTIARAADAVPAAPCASELRQWPIQIKLMPVNAPYLNGANLLIAADCTAFAYGDFHREFIKNRVTLIGCPKLDTGDYSEKLTEILRENEIASVTVVRMEVPCCGGLENAVKTALRQCDKLIPWQVVVISTDGQKL